MATCNFQQTCTWGLSCSTTRRDAEVTNATTRYGPASDRGRESTEMRLGKLLATAVGTIEDSLDHRLHGLCSIRLVSAN
ncbi:hypothetical protein AK812_SmicGene21750 [Symbiodinium microadriaticum]|uniref:Uncharacterized protein n=1 Tax=Symbiodinium microadriaticum TaxID=2951 RepID=A0A1Q9DLN4_SYMMI|nr:hypothetical protein AK812_SmicGene21750 [Symbiodinium microadriaticum]